MVHAQEPVQPLHIYPKGVFIISLPPVLLSLVMLMDACVLYYYYHFLFYYYCYCYWSKASLFAVLANFWLTH